MPCWTHSATAAAAAAVDASAVDAGDADDASDGVIIAPQGDERCEIAREPYQGDGQQSWRNFCFISNPLMNLRDDNRDRH